MNGPQLSYLGMSLAKELSCHQKITNDYNSKLANHSGLGSNEFYHLLLLCVDGYKVLCNMLSHRRICRKTSEGEENPGMLNL